MWFVQRHLSKTEKSGSTRKYDISTKYKVSCIFTTYICSISHKSSSHACFGYVIAFQEMKVTCIDMFFYISLYYNGTRIHFTAEFWAIHCCLISFQKWGETDFVSWWVRPDSTWSHNHADVTTARFNVMIFINTIIVLAGRVRPLALGLYCFQLRLWLNINKHCKCIDCFCIGRHYGTPLVFHQTFLLVTHNY